MSPINGHFRLSVSVGALSTKPLRISAKTVGSAIPKVPWPISEPIDRLLALLFDGFYRDSELHVIRDGGQHSLHVKVAPFPCARRFSASSSFSFWPRSGSDHLHDKCYRLGDATQGKIARNLVIFIVDFLYCG